MSPYKIGAFRHLLNQVQKEPSETVDQMSGFPPVPYNWTPIWEEGKPKEIPDVPLIAKDPYTGNPVEFTLKQNKYVWAGDKLQGYYTKEGDFINTAPPEKATFGEKMVGVLKGIWQGSFLNPTFWKNPQEKWAIEQKEILVEWAKRAGKEDPKAYAEEILARKTEETFWQPATEEGLRLFEFPTRPPSTGYLGGGNPGEKFVGEWVMPMAVLTGLGLSATAGRAALAPIVAQGGVKGVGAQAVRVALAPLAGYEKAVTVGLKYSIGVPLKGVSIVTRKAFEKSLDLGLDHWLVRQGIRGNQANTIIQYFLKVNKRWLYKQAEASIKSKLATRITASQAGRMAADEVIASAEPMLNSALKAITGRELAITPPIAGITPSITPSVDIGMPSIENMISANYQKNLASWVGRQATRLPILGSLIKSLNPMLGAKTDAEKATIAWMGLREAAPSFAQIELNQVLVEDSPFKIAFGEKQFSLTRFEIVKGLKKGEVLNVKPVKGKGVEHPTILQVTERPDDYILTYAQRVELDLLDKILQEQLEREIAAGVDVSPVKLAPGQRYFPRFIKEITDLATTATKSVTAGTAKRPGIRPGSFRERYYDEVLDGIVKGKVYSTDYRGAVATRLTAGNKSIADKLFGDYLKPFGREAKTLGGVEMPQAVKPILGKEGTIAHAALQGRIFPIEIANPINKLIYGEIEVHQVLATAAKVNAVARAGQTAIDTGFMLIQMLMTLANHPGAWGQSFTKAMQTLVNPKYTNRWMVMPEHTATMKTIAGHGGAAFGGTEYTESARAGGWLQSIPGVGKAFERFGLVFEDAIDVGRISIFEAELAHYKAKFGRDLTEAELTDLTTTVDHMVGISSLRRLGVSSFVRSLGSNLLYAPRYYTAYVSLLGRAFQGGLGADLARKSLVKLLIGMGLFMSGMAYVTGQKERIIPTKETPIPVMFDPRSGEFMTVEVGGAHMGLGGVWVSGFRLIGSLAKATVDDPDSFLSIDPHENPILRYAYGRASPVASAAIDVATGSNYLGERLDTPEDYLKEVVDKTFPFWLAGQITDVPKAGWQKGMAEWWGLRAWMVQYNEQAKRYAEQHIPEIPNEMIMPWQSEKGIENIRYEDLNNEQRAWLLNTFADFRDAEDKRLGLKPETGTDFEVASIKANEILDSAYQIDLGEIAQGVIGGLATIEQYQDQSEYLRRIRFGAYQYQSTITQFIDEERWEELNKWVEKNEKLEDTTYNTYMELRGNPPKIAGVPDWEIWAENIDNFLRGLDQPTRDYVLRRQDDWINKLPPSAQKVERLIIDCEQGLKDYYDQPIGKARELYRDYNPDVDARLIILRGLTPRRGLALAYSLLDTYGVSDIIIPPPTPRRRSGGSYRIGAFR